MTDQPTENLIFDPAEHRLARPAPRPKTEMLRKFLARRSGATVAQIQKHLGWQLHIVRAAISRLRSAGAPIELDRSGRVTRYRILPGEGQ